VPADWYRCRVCGTVIPESRSGQKVSPYRALIVVLAGLIGFAVLVLPIWLWRQGYLEGHSAKIVSDENQPTNVRFREQAVADEVTEAGKQTHEALQELNRLNLESSTTDFAKRIDQIPAIVAALDRYERGIARLQADTQKALDENQYSSKKDGHKLETMLTVLEIRKKICAVERRVADKFLLAKTNPRQFGGVMSETELSEYVEEMNSEINYRNRQSAELLRIEEENPGAAPAAAPGVLEVGEFSESYIRGPAHGHSYALPGTPLTSDPAGTSRGFIVTPDGIAIVKLGELIRGSRIQVRLADRRLYRVIYVLAFDTENDIAAVRLGRPVSEFANWPDDLPSMSLEQEGAAHPVDSLAIQLEKYRVNVSLAQDTPPASPGTFLLNEIPRADRIVLNVAYCGAPVVNSAGDVIGSLCSRQQFYPPSKGKPNLPARTPVVSANAIRALLNQDLGMEPGSFSSYMLKEHPDVWGRYAFSHY
jgi:hypothetical protein